MTTGLNPQTKLDTGEPAMSYDNQVSAFVAGEVIRGTTSSATGTVVQDSSPGVSLNYDAQVLVFSVGQVIEGLFSNARAVVLSDSTPGIGNGTLELNMVSGAFQNDEPIVDEPTSNVLAISDGVEFFVDGTLTLKNVTAEFQAGEELTVSQTAPDDLLSSNGDVRADSDGTQVDPIDAQGDEIFTTVLAFTVTSDGTIIDFDEGFNFLGIAMSLNGLVGTPTIIGDAIFTTVNAQATVPALGIQTQLAIAYLPPGRAFGARQDVTTNLHKLFKGLGRSFASISSDLFDLREELPPDRTEQFLDEWESAVMIPDDCIPQFSGNDDRRDMILLKLANMNIQIGESPVDIQSFQEMARAGFGVNVSVESGRVDFDGPNVHGFTEQEAMFTIVITFNAALPEQFTYDFTADPDFPGEPPGDHGFFPFGSESIVILKCLYLKLKPANCNVVFVGA
jgi:uncharacterized protein YmfQ (DUF2313 family)